MSDERSSSEDLSQAANAPASRPSRRSFVPRFGLRTLFVFAILFCLFFAWIGRNFVKMREEDAAIETLKQASAVILLQGDDFRARHPATPLPPGAPGVWGKGPAIAMQEDWYGRLFGWADRLPIRHVNLQSQDRDDEKLDAALEALAVFPEIESVNLHGSGIDDSSLPPLTKIAELETVGLFSTDVSGEGLRTLASAKRLRRVNYTGRADDLSAGLASLTQLRSLSLSGFTGSDGVGRLQGMAAIASLPHLEELTLMHLQATEPGFLRPLSAATKLRSLTIMGRPLTTDDMTPIAELPLLESLRIDGIDDRSLTGLDPLTTLKKIELDSPVTPEAARKFSKAHPDCRVEYALYRPDGIVFQAGEEVEPPATGDARAP